MIIQSSFISKVFFCVKTRIIEKELNQKNIIYLSTFYLFRVPTLNYYLHQKTSECRDSEQYESITYSLIDHNI